MAYLPGLRRKRARQTITSVFGGINRNERISDGEFARAINLSTREYPLLCTRRPRGTVKTLTAPGALLAKEKLCYTDGAKVYYGESEVSGITLSTAEDAQPKRLVSFGAYVLIFPDKKYFNTVDLTDCGDMEGTLTTTGSVSYAMCRVDGSDISNVTVSATEPAAPENGAYWIDTSDQTHILRMYSSTYGTWNEILTVYTRIGYTGVGSLFHAGDTVTISGAEADENAGESAKKQIAALNGSAYVYSAADDSIVVLGLLDEACTQSGGLSIRRSVPKMEFVIESENRLWGCHYGQDADGNTVNELYASKLGDFKNWRVYQGIGTDSYTVSLGSDGPFTGAITYGGYPLFFKEKCVHRIYGAQPKNFQVMTTQLRGVKSGCEKSLTIVDGTLYYVSRAGIEAYDGSLPGSVSDKLPEIVLDKAVGGALDARYYLSAYERDTWHVYVYDTQRGIWLEEDGFEALAFVPYDGDLYALNNDTGELICMLGTQGTPERTIEWEAETGTEGTETIDHKYVTRYNIKVSMAAGSAVRCDVRYDGQGAWKRKMDLTNEDAMQRTLLMPVFPRRCDHLKMRISGRGETMIYNIARIVTSGGDGQGGSAWAKSR